MADVGEDGNLDPQSVRACITERTRALVPVHLAGLPCRMDELWQIAREHGLFVVEDAAHAVGAHYHGVPIGASTLSAGAPCSDAVVFSFYATKNLTTGEGGMVTTPHQELYDEMRLLCLHGISKDAWNRYSDQGDWFYEVVRCGFKYNLSDLQSAIGIPQLRRQEEFQRCRAEYAGIYNRALRDMDEIEVPPDSDDCRHAWHLYSIRLRTDRSTLNRAELIKELKNRGIGASVRAPWRYIHASCRCRYTRP
jgi:dTDP-4-amino-4,6-dideoxygalactose transaminase